ncbi:MAG: hypothetical protein KatS3mg060_1136 [Dehalococcoidia bacterium]|nr:MAG: hypothetical protein KatS3mg060_1136 [Dehalococcoidia bacterium]
MTPAERAGYLAHSRTLAFQRRLDEARRAIEAWRRVTTRRFVSYSAGKDSEVVLHLARQDEPQLLAVWSDDEFNLPETLAQLERTPNLHRIAARVWHAEWFTAWADGPARVPPGTEWVEPIAGQFGLAAWAIRHGYDGVAIGLRAQESADRRRNARRRGTLHQLRETGVWHAYPLAWWRTEDVWAYLVSREVPYNAAYDRLSAIGVPAARQRIGPFAVERVLQFGALSDLRRGWPEEFARFAARFPDARRLS